MAKPTEMKDVIGLIPAAGRATRLGHLPFSKELLPIGKRTDRARLAVDDRITLGSTEIVFSRSLSGS